jgi:NAD(P)H-dependent FMN reductase
MDANNYLLIAGSTRPNRRSPKIAAWVAGLGAELSQTPFQVVDLSKLGLGVDDEPGIPAKGDYRQPSTKAWSAQVSNARGIVFVTPQYNWGYPAPLKAAIDRLYREWKEKPALIVSYGAHGGGKCAAQLREVLGGMDLRLTDAMPALKLARARIEADDGEVDPDGDFADQRDEVTAALRELIALSPP